MEGSIVRNGELPCISGADLLFFYADLQRDVEILEIVKCRERRHHSLPHRVGVKRKREGWGLVGVSPSDPHWEKGGHK